MDNIRPFQTQGQTRDSLLEEARVWVLLFNSDTPPSDKDIQAMRAWAKRSPAHRAALREAEDFWQEAELLSTLAVPLPKAASGRVGGFFSGLQTGLARLLAVARQPAYASAFTLAFTALVLWLPGTATVGNGTYSTAIGEQNTLTLADHSVLHLDTHSQVRIDYQQGRRQIHLLRGKAHFDVAKNPERPFEVYAREGLVRAVGTAFSVYLDEGEVEVIVDEGRVDLARLKQTAASPVPNNARPATPPGDAPPPANRNAAANFPASQVFMSLDRGQGARFDRQQQVMAQLDEQTLAKELAWRDGQLVFVRDPLSQVLAEVSRYTEVKIDIVDPALAKLVVGGRFQVGELDALFEVLEIGFGVKVVYLSKQHVQLSVAGQ
jgi:transmembrane sensor